MNDWSLTSRYKKHVKLVNGNGMMHALLSVGNILNSFRSVIIARDIK